MEAVPRISMLSLELKESAERIEFGPVIKPYISQHYMEDENKYTEEIRQIDQLRINACNVTRDFNGISVLKKYYGQLHLLTSRFPMGEGGTAALPFTWMDTFDEEPFTHVDVAYEQACILYNLGSLHSILGAKESRSSEEEMKVACTHFQCAAGAFTYLRDHFQSDMSPDISFELMTIYINVMLGQAQECLLEKSMQDNRKSSLVARISIQVVDYYRQAMRGLDDSNISSLLGSKKSKTWKKVLTIKMNHFISVAYMFMSNQAEEQHKYGERVTYLQLAVDKHNEAVKLSKGQHESIVDALNFTKDVVVGKFQSAKKDNDFVYHDAVPTSENLPEIKGASLVKALTFQPYDESVAGPDIFRKLVPMEAHEASSLYSEDKAKLLRRVSSAVEEKNKSLDQFMSTLGVEQLNLQKQEPDRLPQVLLEVCAAISVKQDPIKTLINSMQALSNVVLDVDLGVKELDAILKEEDKQEQDFQKEFGPRPSNIMKDLKKEFGKYQEGHAKASRSNQELHRAMEAHIDNIRALAGPLEDLPALLPSSKDSETPQDKEAQGRLQRLLGKVEEMKSQRHTLETQLRDNLQKDDVTSQIVTKEGGNMKDFFEEELKKHSSVCTYIDQNLAAQDNILKAVTDANAAYADTRKMSSDTAKEREEKIQELITSYTVYDDLIAKSHKGTEFYKKLEQGISKLLSKTKGVVKVNQEEREAMIQKVRPKPAPTRPSAPKPSAPAAPVDSAPRGPKLSDFWKPKTTRGGQDSVPSSQPSMYPNASGAAAPGQMYPGVGTVGGPGGAIPTSVPASHAPAPHRSPQHTVAPIHGIENHPGAPGAQEVRPSTSIGGGGNVPTNMPSGHQVSPSHHPPGGMPHQSPVHSRMPQSSGANQSQPMNQPPIQSQPMNQPPNQSQPMNQPPNQSQPTSGVMPQPAGQSQPTGHVRPHPRPQLQQPMSPIPNNQQQQQQFPPSGIQQQQPPPPPPASIYQQGNVNVVQPQQVHSRQPTAYVAPAPSAPPTIPQNPVAPVSSRPSTATRPPPSSVAPQQYTQQPQPNAATVQRYPTPQQPGQWQQQQPQQYPVSQPSQPRIPQNVNQAGLPQPGMLPNMSHDRPPQPNQTSMPQNMNHDGLPQPSQAAMPQQMSHGGPPQPSGVPLNLNQGGQQLPTASVYPNQPHSSMTMVSSNTTPIATPMQQGGVPTQYAPQGQFTPTSVQGAYQPGQPGVQYQSGMGQVGHQMPQQQQQGYNQQPHQQQQQPYALQQQQQLRMPQQQPQQQPGVGVKQPASQQQPGVQQQHLPVDQQPGYQHVQSHMYHQHTGQQEQHPHVYQQQQPPGSPLHQPAPTAQQQPHQQATQIYGHQHPGMIGQQQTPINVAGPSSNQQQQLPPVSQPSRPQMNIPHQQGQRGPISHPQQQQHHPQQQPGPVNRPQQQGPINLPQQQQHSPQQQPGSMSHTQQQQLPMGMPPVQQYQQPQRPAPVSSPLPQQHSSPQHLPRAPAPQIVNNIQQPPQHMTNINQPSQQTPFQQQQYQQQQPQQQPIQRFSTASATGPQGYTTGAPGSIPQNQTGLQQQMPQQNQPGMSGPQPKPPQYAVPGGPGSPQHAIRPQSQQQQQQQGQVQAPGFQQQGQFQQQTVPGQNMPQHNQYGAVNQAQMGQQQQTFQPGAPNPPQQYPNQAPSPPQQQFNYQVVPGAPLTKSQQNQKINMAFKEEQKRLPEPALQPLKVEVKADDLLSVSPDSQQKSIPGTQLLQPQAITTSAPSQSAAPSTSSSSSPQRQPSPPPTTQSGHTSPPSQRRGEDVAMGHQRKTSEGGVGPKDPYGDKETLDKFVEEVERLEKAVEGLSKQMLSGPTVLEKIWKELTDAQDRDSRQYSMAVARCYSMKNRQADVMPYDHNRVILNNAKNDYINASYIKDLSSSTPQFIASQAPVSSSINDFWLMVYEQQITIVAALISHPPVGGKNTGFDQYWAEERGQVQTYGPIMLTMQSKRSTDYHIERVFNLMHRETKQMRTLFLLQFIQWPEFGAMSSPTSLIQFIGEVNNYHKQQRNPQTPVLVHCNCGVGRTGVFCVIYTAIQEMQEGNGIINVPQVIKNLRQQRKWMITDKEQLKFCYDAVLVCAQQMLAKRGLTTHHNSLSSPAYDPKGTPSRINSFDAIMGIDSIESLQDRISHMTVRPQPPKSASSDQDLDGTQQVDTGDSMLTPLDSTSPIPTDEQAQPVLPTADMQELNIEVNQQDIPDKNIGSGLISPDGSSSASLKDLQEINLNVFSQSAQGFIPDVVESNTAVSKDNADDTGSGTGSMEGSNSSLPSILADLTPQNFSIKEQPPAKQKATKADFTSGKSRLGEQKSVDDPFSMLDPMWSLSKTKSNDSQES